MRRGRYESRKTEPAPCVCAYEANGYTKFRKIDKLTREMVAGLIRRITVSEGKQITIQFNYADELASYQQMIAAAAKEVG